MKRSFTLLIYVFALFSLPSFGQTANSSNLLFIFDASGSMWGKIDKSTKIQIAKETMGKLSSKISAPTKVGLIAYGHKSTSDCNDIETLVPIAPFNKPTFNATINALNPKGKTPIAKSINHALALIKGLTESVTIILVSDGLETCEGNACEIVKKAKAAGIKITLHVVGFGIAENDLSPLECLAQAGGGQYFPANNAEELATALEKTVKEMPVGDAFVSVKALLEGKLVDATVRILKKGVAEDIASGRTYTSSETNPRILQIPSGKYDIEVEAVTIRSRPTQKFENVEIKPKETWFKEVVFGQGIVNFKVTRNGVLSDAVIHFYKAGSREFITSSRTYKEASTNPVKFQIPPGEYDIEVKGIEIGGAPIYHLKKINVKSGTLTSFDHDFLSGELKIGAKNAQGYVDATVNVISLKTGESVDAGRTYQSASTNPKKFILEPGQYRIELNPVKPTGLKKQSFTIEIKAKASVEKIATF
jgi:Ca-activated chloride channel family protein